MGRRFENTVSVCVVGRGRERGYSGYMNNALSSLSISLTLAIGPFPTERTTHCLKGKKSKEGVLESQARITQQEAGKEGEEVC